MNRVHGDGQLMRSGRVSVVIPTRDRCISTARALSSVLSQTRCPHEIIVVDDGSTDDTSSVIPRDFPTVRYVRQNHAGVSAARNHGVRVSTGEWIAFLDSDDEWKPDKLERQLQALTRDPNNDFCYTNEIWIRNGRRVNPMKKHAKYGGFIFERCLPLCVISPSSVLLRRALFDHVGGFDESFPVCEDYELWLRICSRFPVLLVDELLVVKYGGHEDQLSRAYWGMDRFRIRALEKILTSGRLERQNREAAIRILIEKIDIFVQGARKRNKTEETTHYVNIRRRFTAGGTDSDTVATSVGSNRRNRLSS